MNPIGNLEYLWNDLISSSQFPTELYGMIPGSLSIDIDARQVGPVTLTQQSLFDLQARKKDMITIAEPVMTGLAGLIQNDTFIVLCDPDGTTILATNAAIGRVCPGVVAGKGIIRRSIQNRCLPELTIYCNEGECVRGYFNSVIFPIHDKQSDIQAVLSMGSFSKGISEELRMAVFLGASLIETRFQYWQILKEYTDSFIGALPDLALLVNENGYIENVNDQLSQLIGSGNINRIIGQPFEKIVSDREKSFVNRITLRENIPITFNVANMNIACTVLKNKIITGPFGTKQQLLVMKESQPSPYDIRVSNKHLGENGFDKLIGMTSQMKAIKAQGEKVAKSSFTVLINGESGTGKELLAEAIHQESGRSGPFIPINCGAIPKELLHSELFGYVEGSFTGGQKGGRKGKLANANGGTVFLDEIGEMPVEMQVAVLRFLQDRVVTRIGEDYGKKVDVRIIAATNRNLRDEIAENRFRLDLYYRLNEITITMPALRNRKEDIPLLMTSMLNSICNEHQMPVPQIEDSVILYLSGYDWPGNCRELQNVLKSALVLMNDGVIKLETLEQFFTPGTSLGAQGDSLEDIERNAIIKRLISYEGNISKAASSLNINRSTLYRKIRDYNIQLSFNS